MSGPTHSQIARVHQLMADYCVFVDSKKVSQLVNLFHPEVTVDYGPQFKAKGREGLEILFTKFLASCESTSHHITNIATTLENDVIIAKSYVSAWHQLPGQSEPLIVHGRYLDTFAENGSQILIMSRTLLMHGSTQLLPFNILIRNSLSK